MWACWWGVHRRLRVGHIGRIGTWHSRVWARWWVSVLAHWRRRIGVSGWAGWHAGVGMSARGDASARRRVGVGEWARSHVRTFAHRCKWVRQRVGARWCDGTDVRVLVGVLARSGAACRPWVVWSGRVGAWQFCSSVVEHVMES